MVSAEVVGWHRSRSLLAAGALRDQLQEVVQAAELELSSVLLRLGADSAPSLEKSQILQAAFSRFEVALADLDPVVYGHALDFVDQLEDFRAAWEGMVPTFSYDRLNFVRTSLLDDHVVNSVGAATSYAARVSSDLRQFLAVSTGGRTAQDILRGAIEVVRRIHRVEPLLTNNRMIWFRTLGDLAYRQVEESGTELRYSYVGPQGKREFCSGRGGAFSRDQVESMDNGDNTPAFVCGGGFGCSHWWAAEVAR